MHFRAGGEKMTDALFSVLDNLKIEYQTTEHPPIHTEEDSALWESKTPGLMCKSLFLKDKKSRYWLIVMPAHKRANLRVIEALLGASRISFVQQDLVQQILGVPPGAVTPFAVMNDKEHCVQVLLDDEVLKKDMMNCHPLRNTASTSLSPTDLVKFLAHYGYTPSIINCGGSFPEILPHVGNC
jgi:Ala-tRNA(Pro) deacylase